MILKDLQNEGGGPGASGNEKQRLHPNAHRTQLRLRETKWE